MTDYWLSKLFFDLQNPSVGAEWRKSREPILDRYPLAPDIRAAVLNDDVAVLAPRVNAYLLRFYLTNCGISDADAIAKLKTLQTSEEATRG
jgi:hypothetical protein